MGAALGTGTGLLSPRPRFKLKSLATKLFFAGNVKALDDPDAQAANSPWVTGRLL